MTVSRVLLLIALIVYVIAALLGFGVMAGVWPVLALVALGLAFHAAAQLVP